MGIRVAYGKRENIDTAILKGTIPRGSIIITKDTVDSEMLFYDTAGSLKPITKKSRFESKTAAEQWARAYPCSGAIFVVRDGESWLPYVVNDDNSLSPINTNDALIKTEVDKNTAAIAILNGTGDGSVSKAVADGVASIVADAPDGFNTLKEIAEWIANDTTMTAKMAGDIAAIVGNDKDESGVPKSVRSIAEEVVATNIGVIPNAAQAAAGLIKGTDGKINIVDGQITSVTTDALSQGADVFVLDGGTAVI